MMIVRPMLIAAMSVAVLSLAGCSREQSDWKAAQAADTIEAYGDFLRKHGDAPESAEARARVEQLGEERDWQRASTSDTRETYAQFIALHPNSKWTQEARIRIENFALGPNPATPQPTPPAAPDSAMPANPAPPAAPKAVAAPKAADATEAAKAAARPKAAAIPKSAAAPKAPAAAAKPLRTVKSAPSTSATIQLGAFNSEAIARSQWQKLAQRYPELSGLEPLTETTTRAGKTLFRLRTVLPDRKAADATCAAMQHKGDPCLVVTLR